MLFLLQTDLNSFEPSLRFAIYLFIGAVVVILAVLYVFSQVRRQIVEMGEKLSDKYKERAEQLEKEVGQIYLKESTRDAENKQLLDDMSRIKSELTMTKEIQAVDWEMRYKDLILREARCKEIESYKETFEITIEELRQQLRQEVKKHLHEQHP